MDTNNPHFLALTETFVTTLVSISGLVACSLLSVCLVPHPPRSHLGNLKVSSWWRDSEKSWLSWLVRTSTVYFIEQCQTYVYNHTPSQTLKPLDYNTSYSLESHPGPGKRSFPSRKTNTHLHQEAWRQGWKMDGCKSSTLCFSAKCINLCMLKGLWKENREKASLLSAKQRLEFASWAWHANPCGALLHRMVSNRTHFASDLWLFGQKKPTFHRISKGENRSEMRRMLNCVFFLMRISYIYIYIMQNIGVFWSICIFKHYVSTNVQIRIWVYRKLFQLANLKVVVQTYVSTIAKLAKHWEQLPVTPHLHQRPPVWPVQLSKGPLYCDQKWNHRSWTAKRQHLWCGV